MSWLPLTLVCALSLATADAVTKKYLTGYAVKELVLVRFVFAGLSLGPLLFVFPISHIPAPFWAWVLALIPLEILAMWLYMCAIRDSPLSLTLPYLAFTPVFTVVTGYIMLGEEVSRVGLLGILLVVTGAYLLNFEQDGTDSPRKLLAPLKAIGHERGSWLMVVVALIYSATSVMGKGALQYVSPSFFGAFYFCLLGIVMLILFSVTQPRSIGVLWRRPLVHLLTGFLMALMVVTHFFAIQEIEVSYMIAIKRTSLIFGIVYGAYLFGEQHLFRNLTSGSLMVMGVIIIAV